MKRLMTAVVPALLLSLSTSVLALPLIQGEILFNGGVKTLDENGMEVNNFQDAFSLTFFDNNGSSNKASVGLRMGDLNVIESSSANFYDIQLDGGNLPIEPLWSVDGFSFYLNAFDITNQQKNELNLDGTGILLNEGYKDTAFTWSFSSDGSGGQLLSFSSTNSPIPVPEPGTLALLGLGLAGLGAARRRQKAA